MNKIVREHYPVARLPEELREGIEAGATVRVIVEEERQRPLSRDEFLASLLDAQSKASGVTIEEALRRVRELRDEWEH